MPSIQLPALSWDSVTSWLIGTPLMIIVTVIFGFFARLVLHRLINRVVDSATAKRLERLNRLPFGARGLAELTGVTNERHVQRATTMGALLKSITTFVVLGVTALTVLAILGIPLGPMLASAGVGGVALAFGAQSLVKDFLSGIFMIVEDQYGVGDVIDTGEAIGTVENVSLRVTQLRDAQGITWYVRNGEIVRIGNRSQGWSQALVDIVVAWDEDIEGAQQVIREAVEAMAQASPWAELFLDPPQVVGVESISNGAVTIRILARTLANQQFGIQRDMRERVKRALDEAGIRSPAVLPRMQAPGSGGA